MRRIKFTVFCLCITMIMLGFRSVCMHATASRNGIYWSETMTKCPKCGSDVAWESELVKISTGKRCTTCGGDGMMDYFNKQTKQTIKNALPCDYKYCDKGIEWRWRIGYKCKNTSCNAIYPTD